MSAQCPQPMADAGDRCNTRRRRFSTSQSTKSEPLVLNLLADNVAGTGFDITLEVFANATSSTPTFSHTFTSLTGSGGA